MNSNPTSTLWTRATGWSLKVLAVSFPLTVAFGAARHLLLSPQTVDSQLYAIPSETVSTLLAASFCVSFTLIFLAARQNAWQRLQPQAD